jgi:hypothetical protein
MMKAGLSFVRKSQHVIKPFLSTATFFQLRKNKKAVDTMKEEVIDENTKGIKN